MRMTIKSACMALIISIGSSCTASNSLLKDMAKPAMLYLAFKVVDHCWYALQPDPQQQLNEAHSLYAVTHALTKAKTNIEKQEQDAQQLQQLLEHEPKNSPEYPKLQMAYDQQIARVVAAQKKHQTQLDKLLHATAQHQKKWHTTDQIHPQIMPIFVG